MTQKTLSSLKLLLDTIQDPGVQHLLCTITQNANSLAELVELISKYQKSGTLKTALEMVGMLTVIKDAMATDSIARMAGDVSSALVIGDQILQEVGGLEGLKLLKKIISQLDLQHAANELD